MKTLSICLLLILSGCYSYGRTKDNYCPITGLYSPLESNCKDKDNKDWQKTCDSIEEHNAVYEKLCN